MSWAFVQLRRGHTADAYAVFGMCWPQTMLVSLGLDIKGKVSVLWHMQIGSTYIHTTCEIRYLFSLVAKREIIKQQLLMRHTRASPQKR